MSLSERIRPNVEAAPWVCDEVKQLEADLAEERVKLANRGAKYMALAGKYDLACGQRAQLAGLLRMIASRGLSPVLTEHELEQIDASLTGLEAPTPGPAPAVKLCVACRTLHPLDHFDKAAPDFPTRDGLNCNCRKSAAEKGYRLMRLPNGKVEPRP